MPRGRPKKYREETLEQKVTIDVANGVAADGESQLVKDLVSKDFAKATDSQALDITSALAELIRGQKFMSEEIVRMRERMAKYDEDARKWEEDREKFYTDAMNKAQSLVPTTEEGKARQAIKTSQIYKEQYAKARADSATAKLNFEMQMRAAPKVSITSPGKIVMVNNNGVLEAKLAPEVIHIKNLTWVLYPGVPTEVPEKVAERYMQLQKDKEQAQGLKSVLSTENGMNARHEQHTLAEGFNKYNKDGEEFPVRDM